MNMNKLTMSAAVTALLLFGGVTLSWAKSSAKIRTVLSGSAIDGVTPVGKVEFRLDDKGRRKLEVDVESVNLPVGTKLTVVIMQGTTSLTLTPNQFALVAEPGEKGNQGELEDETEEGATVPDLSKGNFTIQVNNGTATILTGAINN